MNPKQIKVSVITVSYNTAKYLRKCLDSLKNQTLKEVEFICIDNGSADDCVDILKEYSEEDPRFVCHFTQGFHGRPSYPCAVNFGFSQAKGEYVYILDGDDWLELHALETLYQKAKEDDLDVLGFDTNIIFETPKMEEDYYYYLDLFSTHTPCNKVMTGKELLNFYKKHKQYHVNVFLYFSRRVFLEENRIKMTYLGGDNLYTFQLLPLAKKASHLKETLHFYYMHHNSGTTMSKQNPKENAKKYQMTYLDMLHYFYRLHYTKETEPYFYEEIKRMLNSFSSFYLQSNPRYCLSALETMVNAENMLLGEPLVYFKNAYTTKEDFFTKRDSFTNLCFFGAGLYGEKTLNEFQAEGLTLPLAICDNDAQRQGDTLVGIPIVSLEFILEKYPDCHILVTNQRYSIEILQQIALEIPDERIWFYPLLERGNQ